MVRPTRTNSHSSCKLFLATSLLLCCWKMAASSSICDLPPPPSPRSTATVCCMSGQKNATAFATSSTSPFAKLACVSTCCAWASPSRKHWNCSPSSVACPHSETPRAPASFRCWSGSCPAIFLTSRSKACAPRWIWSAAWVPPMRAELWCAVTPPGR